MDKVECVGRGPPATRSAMRTREHGRRWVPLLLAVVVVGRARCSPTPPPRAEAEANGTTAVEDAHREWDVVRQKLSVLVNGLLDQALPDLTRTVSRLDLSPDCLLSLFRVIGGARRMDLESMRSECDASRASVFDHWAARSARAVACFYRIADAALASTAPRHFSPEG